MAAARRWGWIAALPLLGGCVVGPDFHRPPPPDALGFIGAASPTATVTSPVAGGEAQRFTAAALPPRWWEAFRSPALDRLVERALKANPDLQSAEAALKSARETFKAAEGAYYPQVGVDYNASRQKNPAVLASPLASNANFFSLNTAQLSIVYAPDLFGGVRRQAEAASAQADTQLYQAQAAFLTLTTNVVQAALQEASLRDQVRANRRAITLGETMLARLQAELSAGQAAAADVAAQESALAQSRLALPPLEKQLAQQQDLLAVLAGGVPGTDPGADIELDAVTLPTDLPLGLPSRLVEQRPDIRAAEANLHVASAMVGVAVAARLPNITLTGLLGGTSESIGDVFSPADRLYTLMGDATQPIFQGGALRHKERAARAAYAQAEASYRSTVHGAFQNVADTLHALDQDARTLQATAAAEAAAAHSSAILGRQFSAGEVGAVPVLTAEQADQTALAALVQARAARYADTVALFQALGGGWGGAGAPDLARPPKSAPTS